MKKFTFLFSLLVLSSLISLANVNSQGSGGTPPGFKYTTSYIPVYETPGIDMHTLEAEDSIRDFYKQPFRFGFPFPVQLDFNNSGAWTVLEDGSRMWQLHINCPDAMSVNLGFSNFHIAPGSKLYVYTPDFQSVLGAFTSENQNPDGLYATEIIQGSDVIVEFIEEPNAIPSSFNIFRITHGYRNAESYIHKAFGDAGSCNVNVNCPVGNGWQNQKRSVVCLVSGGSEFCTGAVVNNTANDGTPYVLTANHCGPADGTWVFRFNWQSTGCTNPATSPTSQSLTGATQRAANAGSDVLLCQINTAIPSNYNVYFSGWNRNNVALDSSVCIHHPSGDIKKISFANTPYFSATYNGAQCWQTGLWSGGGVTEPGSSGSPLYDPNKRIIGQLYGGPSTCTTTAANKYDYYGKFSVSWATGTTVATRLREWLDPGNTGVTVLDGYDPNAPTIALDAQAQSVTSPSGTYCSGNGIVPVVVLRNAGVTALTSCTIQYRLDNNTFSTFNWTGNLTTGSTSNITLPSFNTTNGAHTFTYKVSAPNGGTDGNTTNDSLTVSFNVTPPTANAVFPFAEGFQNTTFPPVGWTLNNPDNNYTWARTTSAGGFGQSTASARCAHNSTSNSTGMIDELILPYMNFSGLSTARIRFSVAYARYNAQYFDSLKVMVSSDCGLTWQTLYAKGGSVLATAPDVTSSFTPTAAQWRSDSVVLNSYIGNPFVRIKFVTVSGWGQRLWLDDINLNGLPAAPLSVTLNSATNPSCDGGNNGVVNINVSGGTPAYTFSWSNGATSEDLSSAAAGTYSVTVTDMSGNTASLSNIILTSPPVIGISTSAFPALCNSQNSGSIVASAIGGTGSLSYLWSNNSTTLNISNLSAGTYTLSVIDGNNCVQTATATVNEPTTVSGTPTITDVQCNSGNSGAIASNLSGGTGTLVYSWSNGSNSTSISSLAAGNYLLTVTDGNSCVYNFSYTVNSVPSFTNNATTQQVSCNGASNGSITPVLQNGAQPFTFNWSNGSSAPSLSSLAPGNYNLTITDANNCSASYVYDISEPTIINASSAIQNINCFGQQNGSIALTISGGSPSYSFDWSNGGTTSVITSLAAGNYTVTITDINNCTLVNSYSVTTPQTLSNSLSPAAATCFATQTGSITSNVSGGTSPYSFSWSNNSSQPNLTNVSAGNYSVTITDANGCSTTSSSTVTQPTNINDQDAITHVNCSGASNGSIYTNPTGGTSPFQWNWSNGSTMPTLNNISGGNYSVTITDGNNCTSVFSYNVSEPSAVSAIANVTDAINGANGSVQFVITGGIGPYTISNNGAAASNPATGLAPGSYTFTITDANGCEQSVNATVGNVNGLAEESNLFVSLKPVPFQNELIFEANDFFKVRITDINGAVVFENNEMSNSLKLETTLWAKGIYFVILSGSENFYITHKVVKN